MSMASLVKIDDSLYYLLTILAETNHRLILPPFAHSPQGQAGRVPGVTPADMANLLVALKRSG